MNFKFGSRNGLHLDLLSLYMWELLLVKRTEPEGSILPLSLVLKKFHKR